MGGVAEGRPQKCPGSVYGWPMSSEPTVLPPWVIRLPLAWWGNAVCATLVTSSGYSRPVTMESAINSVSAGRSRPPGLAGASSRGIRIGIRFSLSVIGGRWLWLGLGSGLTCGGQQRVSQLDANYQAHHAPQALNSE